MAHQSLEARQMWGTCACSGTNDDSTQPPACWAAQWLARDTLKASLTIEFLHQSGKRSKQVHCGWQRICALRAQPPESAMSARMLKELKNLTPWQWDTRAGARPPGPKTLAQLEQVRRSPRHRLVAASDVADVSLATWAGKAAARSQAEPRSTLLLLCVDWPVHNAAGDPWQQHCRLQDTARRQSAAGAWTGAGAGFAAAVAVKPSNASKLHAWLCCLASLASRRTVRPANVACPREARWVELLSL